MGKPYSMDLRKRVVDAVEVGGLSCHQAAAQFGVGVSTVIVWVRRLRETGSVAPGQMGGHKPKCFTRHMVTSQRQAATGDTSGWRPKSRCGRPARPTSGGGTGTLVSVAQA